MASGSSQGSYGGDFRRIPNAWSIAATQMRNTETPNNSEFQIQNEDFPALPGTAISASDLTGVPAPVNTLNQAAEMLATVGQQPEPQFLIERRGIITHPDGEVTNIPPQMLADQFGIAALVRVLREVDNESIVNVALGYDLPKLGLNLNLSERHLYTMFGGPYSDMALRTHEIDVKVPLEYMIQSHIRDKLPPVKLNRLSEDVLFYLFYNCPREVYQRAAAVELYARDWRFHKVEHVWLTRSPLFGGVTAQTSTYEKGQYNVFDSLLWRKVPKELKIEYKDLEGKPQMPEHFQAPTGQVGPLNMRNL